MSQLDPTNDDEDPEFDGTMLELVADALGFAVGIYELDEDLIYLSAQWAHWTTGRAQPSYLPTQNFRALIHPDDVTRMTLALSECMRANTPFWEVDVRVRTHDGRWKAMLMQARVTSRDSFGQALRIMSVLFDRANHRMPEQDSDPALQHVRASFEHSLVGILVGTPEGGILRANPAACRMSGYSEEELQSLGRDALLDQADPRLEVFLRRRRHLGQTRSQMRLLHKDGHAVEVELSSVLYVDPQGLRRNVICLQSGSEAMAALAELEQARRWLQIRKQYGRATVKCRTPDALLDELCKLLCECLELPLVWVGALDASTLGVTPRQRHGAETAFLDVAWFCADARVEEGGGPIGRALRSGRVQVLQDVLAEPEAAPWQALSERHQMQTLLALPLTLHEAQPRLLVLHGRSPGHFSARLVDELADLAQEISFALENLARDAALKESEQRFRTLWESALDAIVIVDSMGIVHYANPTLARLFGHRIEEVIGRSFAMLFAPAEKLGNERLLLRYLARRRATRAWQPLAGQAQRKDGSRFPVEVSLSVAMIDGQRCHIAHLEDATRRQQAELLNRQQNAILRGIAGGQALEPTLLAVARLVEAETASRCAFLLSADDGIRALRVVAPSLSASQSAQLLAAPVVASAGPGRLIQPIAGRDAMQLGWMWVQGEENAWSGNASRVLQMALDLATLALEARHAEQRIRRLVQSDELTGLPNRAAMTQALERALARARRDGSRVGMLLLDLDRFKQINERFGQQAGDQALRELSDRLQHAVRKGDVLGRWGGDEFLVLMEQVNGNAALTRVAAKLQKALAQPLASVPDVQLSASIGICTSPEDGADRDAVLRRLELALLHAREQGGATHFQGSFVREGEGLREADLRQGLQAGEFVLHYQPRLDLHASELCGVEALLRWQHPQLGLLWPESFLPLAQSCGLMQDLGHMALVQACQQMRAWQAEECMPPRLIFNISAEEIAQPHLFDWLAQALEESGLAPGVVQLEVGLSGSREPLREDFCRRLQALGMNLSLDDASPHALPLARMAEGCVSGIVLERGLLRGLQGERSDERLLQAMLAAAHALSLPVVAKGVESEAQLECLRRLSCDQIQGYYYCRPLPAAELADFLRRQRGVQQVAAALRGKAQKNPARMS
jgi:diguanylate cyclase (GGDEF)-like protein/PAS domain S-box-containing protein